MKLSKDSIVCTNTLGHLEMCGHDLLEIAHKMEGPFYLYVTGDIEVRHRLLKEYLPDSMDIFYAVKANPISDILSLFKTLGTGFDISSGGELSRCMCVGISPRNISFSGPGKSKRELSEAVKNRVFAISVESPGEIEKILEITETTGLTADIVLRINPTHVPERHLLKMGGLPSQFGIDEEAAPNVIKMIKRHRLLNLMGIHVYNGTQCLDSRAIVENISDTIEIAKRLFLHEGLDLKYINVGGGFGAPYYEGDRDLDVREVCHMVMEIITFSKETSPELKDTRFILELGRFLVAQSGVYIVKVTDIKVSRGKKFIVLSGGMNHHLAASGNLGQVLRRNYKMYPLEIRNNHKLENVNIVGPLCTPIDRIATDIVLPELMVDDYICILNSGAYGATASPLHFLSHDLPSEVFVTDGEIKVVKAQSGIQYETYTVK
ncbi:MAG: hypothetical protein GY941_11900 [Planctomycetes bacterium]|nr:hypothetical protein [Planctomycetota bacterium]